MATTKIYPATQTQAQTIINKIDAMDEKIVTPTYQDKTVTPSDVQQTIQADNGYNALHSVTVEPIAAAMPESLEEFIMNTAQEPYSLSLSGNVPDYACYRKTYLKRVYGNITGFGKEAFHYCSTLESVNAPLATRLGENLLRECGSLQSADFRAVETNSENNIFIDDNKLKYIDFRSLRSQTGQYLFLRCTSLILIDFTFVSSTPILGNINNFENTNNDWIAVVANDTVKAAFQSATNWSTYASHFRTIAEVEAEVGMSYDDYYYQCFGHSRF